ncbi:MAG: amidase family protein, partial [Candidatus Heimdallarchaeota archaeon]
LSDFDAWILPVCSTTAIKHNFDKSPIIINGKAINYWKALGQYCIPFSISGFPVVTMPIGMINGLPVGVQVIARKNEDFKLLAIVKTIEKLFGTRIPPPKLVN